jgi:type I restriction enzyme R subunit
VHLIDWVNPEKNDFALAEEVTLKGGYERRPDIVLYINGIAMVVLELKRSSVELADGVRQLITNQEEIFNKAFSAPCSWCWRAATRRACATAPPARPSSFLWSGRTRPAGA